MTSEQFDTAGQWLDVADLAGRELSDDQWWLERLLRQHGLQIALDVIAFAQNIPLRLLRRQSLKQLDKTFTQLVKSNKWAQDFQTILQEHGPPEACAAAADGISVLSDPRHVVTLRDWVLSLATDKPQPRPASLPKHYENWFLVLLPHLEREVWLTDMGNTHPAHGLARMLEHWSLYVLMWSWKHESKFEQRDAPHLIKDALSLNRMAVMVMDGFFRVGRSEPERGHGVMLLCGPFEIREEGSELELPEAIDRPLTGSDHWFFRTFNRFVRNAHEHVPAWHDILDKAPNATDLMDAFSTRAALTHAEAARRVKAAQAALQQLRQAVLHPSVHCWPWQEPGRPISRANWESIAALTAWLSRWKRRFEKTSLGTVNVHISIPGHRLSLLTTWQASALEGIPPRSVLQQVKVLDAEHPASQAELQGSKAMSLLVEQLSDQDHELWIEMPEAFLARARERQHALWTSQTDAIGSLLARHSRRDRPVGPDLVEDEDNLQCDCEEADHLLRGYGSRICQYLMQMTRAEAVDVLWVDYSVTPPLLRHVGGAERLIQHRATRRERLRTYCEEARKVPPETLPDDHPLQLYRAVLNAAIEPKPTDRKVGNLRTRGQVASRIFNGYPSPKPLDAFSVPLLVNGRVVGAFSISGVNSIRQFDARLYSPLRLVAQHLAQAMVMQAHLWQMRRLNWLASHRPLEAWRQHDAENKFNPLEPIARILANVFLCPVVHVWLRDAQNDHRYKLHGHTRSELLEKTRPLNTAPYFELEDRPPEGAVPLDRNFVAFAIDQWIEQPPGQRVGRAGRFVQARYIGRLADGDLKGEINRTWSADRETAYSLEQASTGMLLLGDKFLNAADAPDHRLAIYETGNLHQCMAFALGDQNEVNDMPLGAISLYAPASIGESILPWATEWRPIVAHIQSYIPYLLMQTEAVASPLDRMRRYLLHEGRNELNNVAVTSANLRTKLHALLDPDGQSRAWVRRRSTELDSLLRDRPRQDALFKWLEEAQRGLDLLKQHLEESASAAQHLTSGEFSENLAVMARMISHQRSLSHFDPNTDRDFDHTTEWFSPRRELQLSFNSYAKVWSDIHTKPDFGNLAERIEILTSKRFWHLMTRDLIYNIAKYALPHEPIRVSWTRVQTQEQGGKGALLRISNFSSYDPDLDQAQRLCSWGKRGSAAIRKARVIRLQASPQMREGQGIGLWGAVEIGKVLGLPLALEIKSREGHPDEALYTFSIAIPPELIREPRGS